MRTSAYSRLLSALVALALALPMGGMAIPAAHADYTQCGDGIDNDSDGQIDYPEDANCQSITDNTEWADNGVFVTVTDERDEISPGEAAQYQITLKQQREAVQLIDVTFHVPQQSGITYVSNDGTILNGGATAVWRKVAVFKDNIRHLSVHAVISPYATEGRLLVTRVTANGSTADDTTMVKNTNSIPYVQNMLQVSIDDHRDHAQPGDILEYLVTVRNPENRDAVVHTRVTIPAALRVTDAAGADFLGNELVWKNVTIHPNQERTFTFRAQVDSRVPKSYPIQVTARAGNVVAYDRTVTGGTPYSLFTTITDNRDFADRGDLLTYVVHVDNSSGRLDTNASINASLPQYSEFVSATEGGYWDGNNVRWLRMQIAPGGSRDLMFTVRVRSDAPEGNLMRATALTQGFTAVDITQVGRGHANGYYGASFGANDYGQVESDVGYMPYDESSDQTLMPVTGVGDFFSPMENTAQFLTPIAAAAEGNGLPLVVWMGVIVAGLLIGATASKKYLA